MTPTTSNEAFPASLTDTAGCNAIHRTSLPGSSFFSPRNQDAGVVEQAARLLKQLYGADNQ